MKGTIIPQKIMDKRRKEIQDLLELIIADNDSYKEDIYKELKKYYKQIITKHIIRGSLLNIAYNALASALSITLTEARKIFNKDIENEEPIKVDDLLYTNDDKTLEDRVDEILNLPLKSDDNLEYCFYRMCLILNTEDYNIVFKTIYEKYNVEYVVIEGDGSNCSTGICSEYADGLPHKVEDVELPPYHSNCECLAIFFTKDEVLGDL